MSSSTIVLYHCGLPISHYHQTNHYSINCHYPHQHLTNHYLLNCNHPHQHLTNHFVINCHHSLQHLTNHYLINCHHPQQHLTNLRRMTTFQHCHLLSDHPHPCITTHFQSFTRDITTKPHQHCPSYATNCKGDILRMLLR